MSGIEIVVDLSSCQGYANCVTAAPELFDVDEGTGLAILLDPSPGEEQLSAALEAEQMCPAGAISVKRPG